MRLTKGHGTQNDFLILADLDGTASPTAEQVAALCDRRAGIGADGVLRVVRSENDPDSAAQAGAAPFFMDYRNADGSLAEMCGNGVRVFAEYLRSRGLIGDRTVVATRGGPRPVHAAPAGWTVLMGEPKLLPARPAVTVGAAGAGAGVALEIPNPHVVVPIADQAALAALDLSRAPLVDPPLPHGQNVEFVVRLGPRQLRMRVHERGSGETHSCGTGICAAAVASAVSDGAERDGSSWQVDVPGGRCEVRWRPDGQVLLTGPAVLVGEVDVEL